MRNGTSLAGDAVRSSIEAPAMRRSVYLLNELQKQNLNRAQTELSGGRSWGRKRAAAGDGGGDGVGTAARILRCVWSG